MSKKDAKDLLQWTIEADGKYQRQLVEVIEQKNDEIERLNNIIDKIYNEVLNMTEEMYKTLVKIDVRGYYSASLTRLDYLLDKTRKLKGVDKDERINE